MLSQRLNGVNLSQSKDYHPHDRNIVRRMMYAKRSYFDAEAFNEKRLINE